MAQASSPPEYSPVDDVHLARKILQAGFDSRKSIPIPYRRDQLLQLAYLFEENRNRFSDAYIRDFGQHELETTSLLDDIINDCVHAIKHLEAWSSACTTAFSLTRWATAPAVSDIPKGVILIISPPFDPLRGIPVLAGAIAAGCACAITLSAETPAISSLLSDLFKIYLDQDMYMTIPTSTATLQSLAVLQWDHIVYSGPNADARTVAAAAAQFLTPITIEGCGQNVAIVDSKVADIQTTCRKLLLSKALNAGQNPRAPHYVLVPAVRQDSLAETLKAAWRNFYPEGIESSPSFGRLCSDEHVMKLKTLLERTKGELVVGGGLDVDDRYLSLTIVKNVHKGDVLLEQDLPGPILPIVPVDDIAAAVDFIKSQPCVSNIYLFTDDEQVEAQVLRETTSSAVYINEAGFDGGLSAIPNGGSGRLQSKRWFDTFSVERTVIRSSRWLNSMTSYRFPPYTTDSLARSKVNRARIPAPRPGPGVFSVNEPREGKFGWMQIAGVGFLGYGLITSFRGLPRFRGPSTVWAVVNRLAFVALGWV